MVISLDTDGTLGHRFAMGINGYPEDEWHGRTLTWSVQANLRAEPVKEVILGHLALFRRARRGHTVVWDGRNYVGQLTRSAQKPCRTSRTFWMV
ncbi:hypothetical protein ACFSC4_28690 [Deinococcus malanensis]|uniref:hypothetical protein n=1 Tax=Deinococcus malanensis TaxID=1706855 RepID=UPI003635957A